MYLVHTFSSQFTTEGSQGKDSRQETEAENMEELGLLAHPVTHD